MIPSNITQKRRVLLMYITKVSGHRQASMAIQQVLHQMCPDIEAPAVNGFGYTYPLLEKIVGRAYMSVIKRTPKVWDYLYDNPKVFKNSQGIKNFLHKTSHKKIAKLFDRFKPDTIVCTQAFPCGMVADYKINKGLSTKVIGVLTDFSPHSYWINEGVDYYIVPSVEVKERFMKKGVPSDCIKVYGIPIKPKFSMQLDRNIIAQKLGLNPNIPTVLLMGGGHGLGPLKKIVESLMAIHLDLQMIVLTGINKKIYKALQKKIKESNKNILLFEFVSNVDELMELATLIVTKPGGIATAECLAKGLPMVVVNPIPGQEMRNTDFLINKGIGIRIDDINNISEEVELLLKSPERLKAMAQAAKDNAKPDATLDIVKLILEGNAIFKLDAQGEIPLQHYV